MRFGAFGMKLKKALTVKVPSMAWRSVTANLMMLSFIIMTSVGAALLLPAAGFITAGVCCGIFGYLLGSE